VVPHFGRPRSATRRDTPHTQRAQCWVRGSPPVRADGGALTHGELRCQPSRCDPRTRAQRLRETMTDDGWAGMSEELFEKVLEVLQPAGPSKPQDGGLGFSQTLAAVRLVCAGWKKIHDAMVTRLVLRPQTTDEAVGMLALRFPAVVSLEIKTGRFETALTDKGLRAVSSLASLTHLNLRCCRNVTDEGVRAVSNCTALKSLNLWGCIKVSNEGVRAVSSLPALTFLDITCCDKVTSKGLRALSSCTALTKLNLRSCNKVTSKGLRALRSLPALTSIDLRFCDKVTDEGVRALSSLPALTFINLRNCVKVMDEGVRALSSLPALTFINLRGCSKVTAAGVQALRSSTAAPSLLIIR
jgi:hypothetical protein